ncbi:hypothetical protein H696_01942 [Fonticula alba]|uniref:Uncharacterized protein n=1 Tax=Fonticula alba TaxID=691883 RepID=A0A058ZAN1_FONAL|nr:hypothetical protein H696_01942 [Fonticula alba]KCV70996.1 hypothetical protein H696_01942 [Fonticula alba]|eukprot:XP_009494119.1 hypothetical protein H696_01942 [Fonticula alba]
MPPHDRPRPFLVEATGPMLAASAPASLMLGAIRRQDISDGVPPGQWGDPLSVAELQAPRVSLSGEETAEFARLCEQIATLPPGDDGSPYDPDGWDRAAVARALGRRDGPAAPAGSSPSLPPAPEARRRAHPHHQPAPGRGITLPPPTSGAAAAPGSHPYHQQQQQPPRRHYHHPDAHGQRPPDRMR